VLRAVKLARIVGDERPRVGDLAAFDVDDAKAMTCLDPNRAALAGRDVNCLSDRAMIRTRS
jgi:hypothetical protein